MNEGEGENARAIGSVKAAINKYGGKINFQGINSLRKTQRPTSDSEKPSKASELHLAKKKIGRLNEDTKMADLEKSQAELELLDAKKTVRELTSQIEELKSKANERNKAKGTIGVDDHQYEELAGEVEALKRELSELKLDMGRASEEKLRAEREAEAASLRLESYMSSAEQLRREIEEANEEEVLVELAKIQARKELAEIEAQRTDEREKFLSEIEETRKRICILTEETEQLKGLEEKLADTNSDLEVLQNELNLIREMDKKVEMKNTDIKPVVPEDLEDVKNELKSIKRGAFQLMASMDLIRIELQEVTEEKERMQQLEEETENSLKNLNSELLRARDELEAVIASEEKEKPMLSNLSLSLDNLEKEKEAALKERERAQEEIEKIRTESQKTETETDITEERLYAVMQELTSLKSAEMEALKKLKAIAENAAETRASASKKKSTISISRFEYDYLTGCAIAAQELAEKKMAAANAWGEALRASEKEMKMKIGLAEREVEELELREEEEIQRMEKSLNAKEMVKGDMQDQRKQRRTSIRENSYSLPLVRQAKFRRSIGSPMARRVNTSFTVKRRKAAILKIGKYFASEQVVNERGVPLESESNN